MTKDETLKLALDFIKNSECGTADLEAHIKKALAQPEQEPVAWEQFYPEMGSPKLAYLSPTESSENACYIPPQRTWVGLTDEEVHDIVWSLPYEPSQEHIRAIEAKLKEKNA